MFGLVVKCSVFLKDCISSQIELFSILLPAI